MRIAVLSDVHGNALALWAVLAHASARGVEQVVQLGDAVSGPLQPADVVDLLISGDVLSVRGDHDRAVLEDRERTLDASDRFARAALAPHHRTWLAALPRSARPAPGVLAVHGSPRADDEHLLHSVAPDGLRPAGEREVRTRCADVRPGTLVLAGHTHLPGMRRLADGTLVVNPGSVGLPAWSQDRPYPHVVEAGSPHARYAVVERTRLGWQVEHHAVAYDWDMAAATAERQGRPEVAHALRTGFLARSA